MNRYQFGCALVIFAIIAAIIGIGVEVVQSLTGHAPPQSHHEQTASTDNEDYIATAEAMQFSDPVLAALLRQLDVAAANKDGTSAGIIGEQIVKRVKQDRANTK